MACRLAEGQPPGITLLTPLGRLLLRHDADGALHEAIFEDGPSAEDVRPIDGPAQTDAAAQRIIEAFSRYFAGEADALAALAVAPCGSDFERAVWAVLRRIPPGETRSYADVARALGGAATGRGPNARAVGRANGRNPIALAIPCHRVIGADGSLTGYAGGLHRKRWLLAHEGWRPAQESLI